MRIYDGAAQTQIKPELLIELQWQKISDINTIRQVAQSLYQ